MNLHGPKSAVFLEIDKARSGLGGESTYPEFILKIQINVGFFDDKKSDKRP